MATIELTMADKPGAVPSGSIVVITATLDTDATAVELDVDGTRVAMTGAAKKWTHDIGRATDPIKVRAVATVGASPVESGQLTVPGLGSSTVIDFSGGEYDPGYTIAAAIVVSILAVAIVALIALFVWTQLDIPSSDSASESGTFGGRFAALVAVIVAGAGALALLAAAFLGCLEVRSRLRRTTSPTSISTTAESLEGVPEILGRVTNMRATALLSTAAVALLLSASWIAVSLTDAADPQIPATTSSTSTTSTTSTTQP
jgi:hypothetical protein